MVSLNPIDIGAPWLCIPSARPGGGSAGKWKAAGYNVALFVDSGHLSIALRGSSPAADKTCDDYGADLVYGASYPGYAISVNFLIRQVSSIDFAAGWFIAGGDDTLPDQRPPKPIAAECSAHFRGTFGVMQPTGDRWAGGQIDRICGSPWLGREFCSRANQGGGPLWHEYRHMFVDEELQNVAKNLGVLWQRPDLTHRHEHFCRFDERVDWDRGRQAMPAFLREANTPEHWQKYKALFEGRQKHGFPGSSPLPHPVGILRGQA